MRVLPRRVWVVTVTYADRIRYLRQVVESAIDSGVGSVVVVDNASAPRSQKDLKELEASSDGRLFVVRMEENLGSAGGYAEGIRRAYEGGAEYIWLLDDDNRPTPDALRRLLDAYSYLGSEPRNVLLSFRPSRKEQRKAVYDGVCMGIVPNSFLGFHVKDLHVKLLNKPPSHEPTKATPTHFPIIRVAYAPYGGLFFHRSWVERVGLPKTRFYLYGDDHEYTSRITRSGGSIFLCAESIVEDVDKSWYLKPKNISPWIAPGADEARLYYSLRNRVWLEKHHVTSVMVYSINVVPLLVYLLTQSLLREKQPLFTWRRILLLCRAFRDGWLDHLGRRDK